MAFICLSCFPKRSTNFILLRNLKLTYCEQKLIQPPSPSKSFNNGDAPIKFTANKASSIKIAETIGLSIKANKRNRVSSHIVFGSLAILLIYFCFLREENDIDEVLKGNNVSENDDLKLINMKLQLHYCEKSGLPTQLLKAKINELEEKKKISVPLTKK